MKVSDYEILTLLMKCDLIEQAEPTKYKFKKRKIKFSSFILRLC